MPLPCCMFLHGTYHHLKYYAFLLSYFNSSSISLSAGMQTPPRAGILSVLFSAVPQASTNVYRECLLFMNQHWPSSTEPAVGPEIMASTVQQVRKASPWVPVTLHREGRFGAPSPPWAQRGHLVNGVGKWWISTRLAGQPQCRPEARAAPQGPQNETQASGGDKGKQYRLTCSAKCQTSDYVGIRGRSW